MPGAIVGVVSWPATFTGAHGLMAGLSIDCRRTSREITSALAAIHEEARPPGRGRRSKAEAKGQPAVVATEQRRGVISKL